LSRPKRRTPEETGGVYSMYRKDEKASVFSHDFPFGHYASTCIAIPIRQLASNTPNPAYKQWICGINIT
jgi:hypothetical protein